MKSDDRMMIRLGPVVDRTRTNVYGSEWQEILPPFKCYLWNGIYYRPW